MDDSGRTGADAAHHEDGLTRRAVTVRGLQAAAGIGAIGMLSACGSSSGGAAKQTRLPKELATTSGTGTPKPGGTLIVGAITEGEAETIDPIFAQSYGSIMRALCVFDRLFDADEKNAGIVPRLALSAEPDAAASVWTVKLRPDVRWHDGKPFTSDDVIWTFNQWQAPYAIASGWARYVNVKRLRKIDDLTLEVPLVTPNANWPATVATPFSGIVQDQSTPEARSGQAIGTGAFKLASFERSARSVLEPNRDYWDGAPHVDRLEFLTNFSDENARLNALLSKRINVMPQVPPLLFKQQEGNAAVTRIGSPGPYMPGYIIMRVDEGPLVDARVRQAMKLVADRRALIDQAYGGYGEIGNDLPGLGNEYFADDLKPTHDPEKAKALMKQAGRSDHRFTLATSAYAPGVTEAATIFAQQAKAAGINIDVKQVSPATYFTAPGGYLTGAFRQDSLVGSFPALAAQYQYLLSSGAAVNESYWGSQQPGGRAAQKLINDAIAATDSGRAQQLWREVQTQQVQEGGNLIWTNALQITLVASGVKGVSESYAGFTNLCRFNKAWIG